MDEYWLSAYREDRDHLLAGVAAGGPFTRVLDIGCNSGPLRRRLREAFGADFFYTGVDYNEEALARARAHAASDARATFLLVDLRLALPFETDAFDLAVSTSVLQVIAPDVLRVTLDELHRVAGGRLVVVEDYGDGHTHTQRGWEHNYPEWVTRCYQQT